MKTGKYMSGFVIILSGLLLTSCLLPGMIPLTGSNSESATSMPTMEKDAEVLLQTLKGQDWVYLQSLAREQYTEADYAKPGTLAFTVTITDNTPTYFNYGWCATTEEILKQNFEHIRLKFYFNEDVLGADVVHPVSFTRTDGLICIDFGVLMSDWTPGEYKLEAVVTFDEKINDGLADFEAGDYVFVYNVTVEK